MLAGRAGKGVKTQALSVEKDTDIQSLVVLNVGAFHEEEPYSEEARDDALAVQLVELSVTAVGMQAFTFLENKLQ